MSLVTLGDQAKALAMIVPGISSKRERMLRSLAGKTTWTDKQRELVETMWAERQQRADRDAKGNKSCRAAT